MTTATLPPAVWLGHSVAAAGNREWRGSMGGRLPIGVIAPARSSTVCTVLLHDEMVEPRSAWRKKTAGSTFSLSGWDLGWRHATMVERSPGGQNHGAAACSDL